VASPRCPVCRWQLQFSETLGSWSAQCVNCHCPVQDLPVTLHEHPIVDVLRQANDRLTAREIHKRLGWRSGVDPVNHQLRRLAYRGVISQSTDGSRTFRLEQPRLRPGEAC
jgi:Fe2+ or Zn2+ uptake regulation protein